MIELILVIYGAWAYRWRGTDKAPKALRVAVFVLPYFIMPFYTVAQFDWQGWEYLMATFAALIGGGCAAYVTAKGHGNTMDIGHNEKDDPEWYEKYLTGIKPRLSRRGYEIVAHSFGGLLGTLPAGVLSLNPVMAVSGATKGLAYAFGWKYGGKTETGEALFGAFSYAAI